MSEATCVGRPWLKRSRPTDSCKYSLPSRKSRFAFIASRCRRGLTAPPRLTRSAPLCQHD